MIFRSNRVECKSKNSVLNRTVVWYTYALKSVITAEKTYIVTGHQQRYFDYILERHSEYLDGIVEMFKTYMNSMIQYYDENLS